MIVPRRTSVVILITLAELAWLAAFGLLFAYRSKVGELGNIRSELDSAQMGLHAFTNSFLGKTPEEAAHILTEAEKIKKQLAEAEKERRRLEFALDEKGKAESKAFDDLRVATNELAKLQEKWNSLPPNLDELAVNYRDATNRVNDLQAQLENATTNIEHLTDKIGQLEKGEIAIRRELTGLPTNELHRVVFIVDTSSSMHGSPAWNSARELMRTWVEHLAVEECMLVNFNDTAVAFPKRGYVRVRDETGRVLPEKKKELLSNFDQAQMGTYSDLLKGLELAYRGDPPDVIVLFTDGHPHIATHTDPFYADQILKEVAKHPGTPILTVAVGSYEVEGAGGPRERANAAIAFLKRLAAKSGGSFLGR